MTIELLRKQLKKLFNDVVAMHKAKNGFNLAVFDNKENEIVNFITSNGGVAIKLDSGVNWANRNWTSYYVEIED